MGECRFCNDGKLFGVIFAYENFIVFSILFKKLILEVIEKLYEW